MSAKVTTDHNLIVDIIEALKKIDGWGSVEIFVQDNQVVQITARNIRKTKHQLAKVITSWQGLRPYIYWGLSQVADRNRRHP